MNVHIDRLRVSIEPLRKSIVSHKVYSKIRTVNELKIFMQHHVYAVWDFMSLLKSLQSKLTCISIPWFPSGLGDTRYLINEIVIGEESDTDQYGNRKSHFELYLDAMHQIGISSNSINSFIDTLKITGDFHKAFDVAQTPESARKFVDFTFETIKTKEIYIQAAVFTFGREDLIPGMFMKLVDDLDQNLPDTISIFKYYLQRHIEVDGEHHSILALKMLENLCGNDEYKWHEVEIAVKTALQKRIELWDGVFNVIAN